MLKEYLISGTRILLKNKAGTIINVLGLALGIASSLILFVVINFELSFDTFNSNYKNIYRITHIEHTISGDKFDPGIYYPMGRTLRMEMPHLAPMAMVKLEGEKTIYILKDAEPELYKEDGIGYADQEIFSIFDFRFLQGSKEDALTRPGSVVLTEQMAMKYFNGDAMGKEITLERELTATVSAVIANVPENSNFPFKMIFRFDDLEKIDPFYSPDKWNLVSSNVQCYFIKPENTNADVLGDQLTQMISKYRSNDRQEIYCQPLSEIHFDDRFESFGKLPVSKEIITALGFTGLILILTACINFINLATAQSIKRAKESGIRKVLGSSRLQLIAKFLLETGIITLLSILLALGIAELSINQFKDFIEAEKDIHLFDQVYVYYFLGIIFVFVSLSSGLAPAYIISRYNPADIIRRNTEPVTRGFWSFRKGLVLIQFVISQLLLVCAITILGQLKFFNSQPLGFETEQVIIIPLPHNETEPMRNFRNLALQNSRIRDVTFSTGSPMSSNVFNSSFGLTKDKDDLPVDIKTIDEKYASLYHLEIISGRNITISDSAKRILVNERMLDMLDWTRDEAIGKQIYFGGDHREIIGVVRNFYDKSLQQSSSPIIFIYFPGFFFEAGIKLSGNLNDLPEIINHLNTSWRQAYPGYYFDYSFLDDEIASMYKNQQQLARLINIFTFIAIFISGLGLYGLILFMANQKTKEIGVRKVLGASINQIMRAFILEFILLLAAASLIAAPMSFMIMNKWLHNFAYHIEIRWWIFALAFVLGFIVALFTVGFRSYTAATTNPVNALRNE